MTTVMFLLIIAAIVAAAIVATATVVHYDRWVVAREEAAALESRLADALTALAAAEYDAHQHRELANWLRREVATLRERVAELGELADKYEGEGAWARHCAAQAEAARDRAIALLVASDAKVADLIATARKPRKVLPLDAGGFRIHDCGDSTCRLCPTCSRPDCYGSCTC